MNGMEAHIYACPLRFLFLYISLSCAPICMHQYIGQSNTLWDEDRENLISGIFFP